MLEFIVEDGAGIPEYGSNLASGLDVTAFKILKVFRGDREIEPENLLKVQEGFNERGYIKLRSLERILFGTGVCAVLPVDVELQVRARSGMALKRGLSVLNGPGTVDADYTGEIGVIMYNSTPFLNKIEKGERIAQIVPALVLRPDFNLTYKGEKYIALPKNTEVGRGAKGFGSTGVNVLDHG
jgi:dUTP pyrophosphatase